LFLDTNPDGSARVIQLFLGKFSVFTDRDTRKEFAYRSHTPVEVHLHPQNCKPEQIFDAEQYEKSNYKQQWIFIKECKLKI